MFHYLKYRSRMCEYWLFGAKIKPFFLFKVLREPNDNEFFQPFQDSQDKRPCFCVLNSLALTDRCKEDFDGRTKPLRGLPETDLLLCLTACIWEVPSKDESRQEPKTFRKQRTTHWPVVWHHKTVTHYREISPVSFQPHVVHRHTHAAMATAVAQFCCYWRHPPSCKCTPPFLCVGHGNLNSAVMGSHLALKTAVRLSQQSPLKPQRSINMWGPNRKWHNGWRRMRHLELVGGPSSGKYKDHSWEMN